MWAMIAVVVRGYESVVGRIDCYCKFFRLAEVLNHVVIRVFETNDLAPWRHTDPDD